VNDLVSAYNGGVAPVHVRSAVCQIYGYMCCNGVKYGVLTTYDKTWFMYRDSNGTLFVTRCFNYNDVSTPSVLQMYAYVLTLAEIESTCESPPWSKSANSSPQKDPKNSDKKGDDDDDDEEDDDDDDDDDSPEQSKKKQKRNSTSSNPATKPGSSTGKTRSKPMSGQRLAAKTLLFTELPARRLLACGRTGKAYTTIIDGINSVIKVADVSKQPEMREDLDNEAAIYSRLQSLQGRCIPRSLFVGDLWEGLLYGLATEKAGDTVASIGVENLSDSEKQSAMAALTAVHEGGVLHNDIRLENLVRANDICSDSTEPSCQQPQLNKSLMLIDFAGSEWIGTEGDSPKRMAVEMLELRRMLDC
jgi:hypothetical protein